MTGWLVWLRWGVIVVLLGLLVGLQLYSLRRTEGWIPTGLWRRYAWEQAIAVEAQRAVLGDLIQLLRECRKFAAQPGLTPEQMAQAKRILGDCVWLEKRYEIVLANLNNLNTNGYQAVRGVRKADGIALERVIAPGTATQTELWCDILLEHPGEMLGVTLPNGMTEYTRDGALRLDDEGELRTVDGYALDPRISGIPTGAQDLAITLGGAVEYRNPSTGKMAKAGQIVLYRFAHPERLLQINPRYYCLVMEDKPVKGLPGADGFGEVRGGWIEGSNVDCFVESQEVLALAKSLMLLQEQLVALARTPAQ